MRFSLDWIDDFLTEPQPADRARSLLDQAGLPVESVEAVESPSAPSAGARPVFDVEITPNRPDAMSHFGLAREIAALSRTELAPPAPELEPPPTRGEPVESLASVVIQVPRRCRRFGALLLNGISSAPATDRVRARLESIGSHVISAPVDATNYALWALGQPLHAFDFDKLSGGIVLVRKARAGETLVTLDGVERRLEPSDIVVADAERAVSLAGIMGGLETAVTPSTRRVLLEAAWWDPVCIRRTARRLGMHTDASHRFERGADINAIPGALNLAAHLILESAGGALAPGLLDARGIPFKLRRAALRLSRLHLLGGDPSLPLEFAEEALSRFGFQVERRGKRISVEIPYARHDVRDEDDLVEEVLRAWGYERLPSRLPPVERPGRRLEPHRIVEESLVDGAVASGLYETVGYPFVDRASQEAPFEPWLRASGMSEPLTVANPLDETRRNLRATLLPGLLDAALGEREARPPRRGALRGRPRVRTRRRRSRKPAVARVTAVCFRALRGGARRLGRGALGPSVRFLRCEGTRRAHPRALDRAGRSALAAGGAGRPRPRRFGVGRGGGRGRRDRRPARPRRAREALPARRGFRGRDRRRPCSNPAEARRIFSLFRVSPRRGRPLFCASPGPAVGGTRLVHSRAEPRVARGLRRRRSLGGPRPRTGPDEDDGPPHLPLGGAHALPGRSQRRAGSSRRGARGKVRSRVA